MNNFLEKISNATSDKDLSDVAKEIYSDQNLTQEYKNFFIKSIFEKRTEEFVDTAEKANDLYQEIIFEQNLDKNSKKYLIMDIYNKSIVLSDNLAKLNNFFTLVTNDKNIRNIDSDTLNNIVKDIFTRKIYLYNSEYINIKDLDLSNLCVEIINNNHICKQSKMILFECFFSNVFYKVFKDSQQIIDFSKKVLGVLNKNLDDNIHAFLYMSLYRSAVLIKNTQEVKDFCMQINNNQILNLNKDDKNHIMQIAFKTLICENSNIEELKNILQEIIDSQFLDDKSKNDLSEVINKELKKIECPELFSETIAMKNFVLEDSPKELSNNTNIVKAIN